MSADSSDWRAHSRGTRREKTRMQSHLGRGTLFGAKIEIKERNILFPGRGASEREKGGVRWCSANSRGLGSARQLPEWWGVLFSIAQWIEC
ncbi:hypothetical protein SRHO_G00170320 [Serrasalmus rhombeus]